MESKNWKIADFGLTSEATSKQLITSHYGREKPGYRAPELISERSVYNNKTDIWALGCIIGELITGMKTFTGDYAVIQYSMDGTGEQFCSLGAVQSTDGKLLLEVFFVAKLLSRDPLSRPSAKHLERLYQIPIVCMQSGLTISRGTYAQTALEVLSMSDRVDLASALVKTLRASATRFEKSPWPELVQKLAVAAAKYRDRELMSSLLKVKVSLTRFIFDAVIEGDVDVVQCMLESGLDINQRNKNNETLLHCAAFAGHREVLSLLLDHGADVHATVTWAHGEGPLLCMPLHYAAVGGNPAVVRLLLASGADVEAVSQKLTASNLAALNGNVEVLKLLLQQTGKKFNNGLIPEHYDSEWMRRHVGVWKRATLNVNRFAFNKWELYQLPSPFKFIGDGWITLFNGALPRRFGISLVHSFPLGEKIYCVRFSGNGVYVAAATVTQIKIFDCRNNSEIGSLIHSSPGHEGPAEGDFLTSFNMVFCSGSRDNIITAFDKVIIFRNIQSQGSDKHLRRHESRVCDLQVPREGPNYLLVSRDVSGAIILWDTRSSRPRILMESGKISRARAQ